MLTMEYNFFIIKKIINGDITQHNKISGDKHELEKIKKKLSFKNIIIIYFISYFFL